MREASPQDGLLDSDQTRFYTEMFDRQLTQKLSSGKGIGLADMMVKQLSRASGQVVQGAIESVSRYLCAPPLQGEGRGGDGMNAIRHV